MPGDSIQIEPPQIFDKPSKPLRLPRVNLKPKDFLTNYDDLVKNVNRLRLKANSGYESLSKTLEDIRLKSITEITKQIDRISRDISKNRFASPEKREDLLTKLQEAANPALRQINDLINRRQRTARQLGNSLGTTQALNDINGIIQASINRQNADVTKIVQMGNSIPDQINSIYAGIERTENDVATEIKSIRRARN